MQVPCFTSSGSAAKANAKAAFASSDPILLQGPPVCSGQKADRFAALKTQLQQADTARSFPAVALGVKQFDAALAGGLRFGHVHLMTGRPFDGAATGFVLAILRLMMAQDSTAPVVWCSPCHAGQAGHVLASALPALGVSPSRFIFVHDQHPKRLMGAFEEVLQTRGILAVVGEYGLFARNAPAWQRWARRTRLAAQTGGGMGILLGAPAPVSGFETGWQITAAPGGVAGNVASNNVASNVAGNVAGDVATADHDWRPCWAVRLDYTRQGRSCADRLRYDALTGRLHPASPYAEASSPARPAQRSGVLPAALSASLSA